MIRVGTSGWNYPHWRGTFYPTETAPSGELAYYSEQLDTVELNKSFYNLPSEEHVRSWYAETPPGFTFAVKASRYITHMKKLKDPKESTARFFSAIRRFEEKLGPLLFQLPPRWKANPARLSTLLQTLPQGLRYAFEFRDTSWMTEEVLDLLREAGAAFCIYELAGYLSPLATTADFAYVRLHGPEGAYEGSYDREALASWASWARAQNRAGRDVYLYFDNDQHGYAPRNAVELASLLRD